MAAPVPSDFRLRVLVIDDDAKLAAVIAESLTRKGHAVEVAASGKLGAKRIEADEFDMVLTDLRMSDLDGLTIVQKARDGHQADHHPSRDCGSRHHGESPPVPHRTRIDKSIVFSHSRFVNRSRPFCPKISAQAWIRADWPVGRRASPSRGRT